MQSFITEFKAFAMRGNVIDLAVAVVIGGAFGKIVSSLVDNIITPAIGLFMGGVDLSGLAAEVGDASITYGVFIQSIIDFVIIALVIFVVVRIMNTLHQKEADPEENKKSEPSEEVVLLRDIRDRLPKG
ncbi:large-conductance mechanosensitive channel protein MscL [Candidatus Kaiserbacteria bacterium]|nr:large-conductance mechanosensitive channel protein MscL [Candidatus Kaiserbacteria bacterium]